ncbi:unnamed protein product, partial [Mesorhabditis spiculigera]
MFDIVHLPEALKVAVLDQLGIDELQELQLVNREFRNAVNGRGLMPRRAKYIRVFARVPGSDQNDFADVGESRQICVHETELLIKDRDDVFYRVDSYRNSILYDDDDYELADDVPFRCAVKLLSNIRSIKDLEMDASTDYEMNDFKRLVESCAGRTVECLKETDPDAELCRKWMPSNYHPASAVNRHLRVFADRKWFVAEFAIEKGVTWTRLYFYIFDKCYANFIAN